MSALISAASSAARAPVPFEPAGHRRAAPRRAPRSARRWRAAGPGRGRRPPRPRRLGAASAVDALGGEPLDHVGQRHRAEVDAHRAARDGDQLGRDVLGEDHEERRRRRLLDVLEEDRAELVDEVEVLEHEHLAVALGRARGPPASRSPWRSARRCAPGRWWPRRRGGRGGSRPARAAGGARRPRPSLPAESSSAAKARGRGPLARARRPDEQVGVDRVGGRGGQLRDGVRLADDVAPTRRCRSRSPRRRAARRSASRQVGEPDARRSSQIGGRRPRPRCRCRR